MTDSTNLVTASKTKIQATEGKGSRWEDIFSSLPPIDKFEHKKDEIATELAALMSFCQKSRSLMADDLGWKKSRISKVLSGNGNSTVRTIWEFCGVLGYEFDVIFRTKSEKKVKQPWQKVDAPMVVDQKYPSPRYPFAFRVQERQEVAKDLRDGTGAAFYIHIVAPLPDLATTRNSRQVSVESTNRSFPLELSHTVTHLNTTVLRP